MYTNRPTFAWIDLDALEYNFRALRKRVGADIAILAVVKADAYGHGAIPVATTLERHGADCFGVAFVEEGMELRNGGISKPILILGGIYPGEALKAHTHGLTPVVVSLERGLELAREATDLGLKIKVHVKVDTGMTRLGIPVREAVEGILRLAREPVLEIEGLLSHFATVSPNLGPDYWDQLAKFRGVVDQLQSKGVDPPIKHMSASTAILGAPKPPFNMVRPGIMLLGATKMPGFEKVMDLRPVFRFTTQIIRLSRVPVGTPISYGGKFVTQRESMIATLPVGYADGLNRLLSNRGSALVRGKRAPIVGAVCMDLCMLDVTDIPSAANGDEVVFIGRQGDEEIRSEEVAELCNTIPYEIFCNINHRVGRIYVKRNGGDSYASV
ncbi:MAG: alanine racemase [Candidatus Lernaella stagnicola]|nr:alanine racemase [Candidatus Lernaella stagnicola]